ncbi:MAG: type II toxin-antitoxin system HicB family antitoxin [Solirubrobacterales bacterium]
MTQREYTVKVHRDDDNSYWATVDELPGCFASGFTLDELSESIGESVALHLAGDGAPDRPPRAAPVVNIGEMRVTVAA